MSVATSLSVLADFKLGWRLRGRLVWRSVRIAPASGLPQGTLAGWFWVHCNDFSYQEALKIKEYAVECGCTVPNITAIDGGCRFIVHSSRARFGQLELWNFMTTTSLRDLVRLAPGLKSKGLKRFVRSLWENAWNET